MKLLLNIMMIITFSVNVFASQSKGLGARIWDYFFGQGYEIEYCSGERVDTQKIGLKMSISKEGLHYEISPKNWEENETRRVTLFSQKDAFYIFDTHLQAEKKCIVVTGDDVKKKIKGLEKVSYNFNFRKKSQVQIQLVENEKVRQLRNVYLGDLQTRVSQDALEAMNGYDYLQIGGKRQERYKSYIVQKLDNESTVLTLNMQYIKKSNYEIVSQEQYAKVLMEVMRDSEILSEALKTDAVVDLAEVQGIKSLYVNLIKVNYNEGKRNLRNYTQALRKIPFGASTKLLKNMFSLLKAYALKNMKKEITSSDSGISVQVLKTNLFPFSFNIFTNLQADFEALCADDYSIAIPYRQTLSGNLTEIFSVLVGRALKYANGEDYELHAEFMNFMKDQEKAGLSYKEVVSNPEKALFLNELFQAMRDSNKGLPSLSLAMGEVSRVNQLLSELKYERLISQYFVSLKGYSSEMERSHFKRLRFYFEKLQQGSNEPVVVSSVDSQKANRLMSMQQKLESDLYSKKQDLVDTVEYLKNYDANANGMFVRKLCNQ